MDKHIEEIYKQLNDKNSEFRRLFRRMEEIENKLLETEYKKLVEEYTKIHMEMQNIILRQSFSYGIKMGKTYDFIRNSFKTFSASFNSAGAQ